MLQKDTDSCDVVICGVVTGWGRRREMERVTEGYDSCSVVMCGVVTGWGRRGEMESVREWY